MQGLQNLEPFPVSVYRRTLFGQVPPLQSELLSPLGTHLIRTLPPKTSSAMSLSHEIAIFPFFEP